MSVWFWVIAAVVAGWMVQMYVTYQQAAAFSTQVRRLRAQGMVTVGGGGKRYRGGRAFVAMAVDPVREVIVDAVALQGYTTFARAKKVPGLCGVDLSTLIGEDDVPHVNRQQREAARQAATLFVDGRKEMDEEVERGVATQQAG